MKTADVMPQLLAACPGFVPRDDELLHVTFGDFGAYLLTMKKADRADVLRAAATFIERMLVEGDADVQQAATIGALEGIQNVWKSSGDDPEVFGGYLHEKSKRWWNSLNLFWAGQIPHVGAGLKAGDLATLGKSMSIHDVAEFVRSIPAFAGIRRMDRTTGRESLCVYTGTRTLSGLTTLENVIWVETAEGGWKIGFVQYGTTRVLSTDELQRLLRAWVAAPDYAQLKPYEASP